MTEDDQNGRARTEPASPPADQWEAANADFTVGRVLTQTYRFHEKDFPVRSTLTFLRAWSAAALTEPERVAVTRAVVMIGVDRVHPMLYCRGVPLEPLGATMGSPIAGTTVTWRYDSRGVPVLLTLTVTRG